MERKGVCAIACRVMLLFFLLSSEQAIATFTHCLLKCTNECTGPKWSDWYKSYGCAVKCLVKCNKDDPDSLIQSCNIRCLIDHCLQLDKDVEEAEICADDCMISNCNKEGLP